MSSSNTDFQDINDFLQNERFKGWVLGQHSEDAAFWKAWKEANPSKIQLFETAVSTLLLLEGNPSLSTDEEVKAKVEQLIYRIDRQPETRTVFIRRYVSWVAAALVLVSLGMAWLVWRNQVPTYDTLVNLSKPDAPRERWRKQGNDAEGPLLINLPDGSSVLLSKGSHVRYEEKMDKSQREIYLEGEAFFEVAKNRDRPFLVYAKGLTTKVLGTSFRVRAFADEPNVTVSVKTGKVMILPNSFRKSAITGKEITLLPNQEVSLVKENDEYVRKAVEGKAASPAISEIQTKVFNFNFTPVSEVFEELEKTYGVQIEYDQEKMRNCTLTATLTDEPFLDKVRLICLGTESTFELADNKIVIHSKGCL
jgi:transmembrane sensor